MSSSSLIAPLFLGVVGVYLFANAPAPLPDGRSTSSDVPVERVLTMLAHENDVARTLYTKEIVGQAKPKGVAFREDWREPDVHAGPLPALFLRASAERVARSEHPLGLFLGSDMPIEASNRFDARQMEVFEEVRATREPRFFLDERTGLQTAMFPDFAGAPACVSCHNEHSSSPKTDWQLGDVMGATTWTWPEAAVSTETALALLDTLRAAFRDTYAEFLADVALAETPLPVGDEWPREASALPETAVFMERCEELASARSLQILLEGATDGVAPPASSR
jgi:adenylate cyclase